MRARSARASMWSGNRPARWCARAGGEYPRRPLQARQPEPVHILRRDDRHGQPDQRHGICAPLHVATEIRRPLRPAGTAARSILARAAADSAGVGPGGSSYVVMCMPPSPPLVRELDGQFGLDRGVSHAAEEPHNQNRGQKRGADHNDQPIGVHPGVYGARPAVLDGTPSLRACVLKRTPRPGGGLP